MQPLTRTQLFAYGLPALPLALLGLPLYVYVPQFYAEELQLGFAVVGVVLLATRLWDFFSDPLAGWLSDRVSLLGSQRKAWMIVGAPLLLMGAALLFRPPTDVGAEHLLMASLLLYTGWTLIAVPYFAWGAELSGNYYERSRISLYREGFVLVGTLVAPLLAFLTMAPGRDHETLLWLNVLLWLALPLALFVCISGVPERAQRGSAIGWQAGWMLLRENRAFRRLVLAFLLNGIANALPATLFLLFVRHVLQAEAWSGALLLLYFLSALAAIPLWLWWARRGEKHRIWGASLVWACLSFAWVPLLGSGDLAWFALICCLSGISLGADVALPAAMQADVADADRAAGGSARNGLMFGLWGMATKLALALAVGLAFPVLGWVRLDAEVPSALALTTLAWLYGGLPVAMKLIALALIWRFPLDAGRQENLQRRLKHERARQSSDAHRPVAAGVAERLQQHEG